MAAKIASNIPAQVSMVSDVGGLSLIVSQLINAIQGWVALAATRVNASLPEDGSEAMSGPLTLSTYTVATRPTAASAPGAVIFVSDGGAGAVFQGSNGTAWVNLG